jgi:hypothetical protein
MVMKKRKSLRLLVLGFLTWVIPFVTSFGFYDRTGNLNVSYGFFKSVMVVLSSVTGMYALSYHMRLVNDNFKKEGFIAGIVWLVTNYVLDLVVLVPMAGITTREYFLTIGLGYLQIPVMSTAVGIIIQRKSDWSHKIQRS